MSIGVHLKMLKEISKVTEEERNFINNRMGRMLDILQMEPSVNEDVEPANEQPVNPIRDRLSDRAKSRIRAVARKLSEGQCEVSDEMRKHKLGNPGTEDFLRGVVPELLIHCIDDITEISRKRKSLNSIWHAFLHKSVVWSADAGESLYAPQCVCFIFDIVLEELVPLYNLYFSAMTEDNENIAIEICRVAIHAIISAAEKMLDFRDAFEKGVLETQQGLFRTIQNILDHNN